MPILKIMALTKSFGGLLALADVDFEVEAGQIVGLIGPNGSGKTTMLNVISGMFKPTKGKVFFNGKDVTGMPTHVLAKMGMARTFQHNALFKKSTLEENVTIAHSSKCSIGYWGALLNSKKHKLGYDKVRKDVNKTLNITDLESWRNKKCDELPHGIQRMLGFSMALAMKPRLLLVDEPLTGLSQQEIAVMVNLMKNLKENGFSILLVEHHMRIVMDLCDRLVVLSFGKKIAEGLPKDISCNKEVIEAYLGVKKHVF